MKFQESLRLRQALDLANAERLVGSRFRLQEAPYLAI